MIRQEQCDKVCRILDNYLANRPTERDSLIVAVQKAFNALEQAETNCSEIPNNSDTISRQQAIDALRDYLVEKRCPDDGTLTCRLIENEVINKLPPVQPEQRWIPVSEALPEVKQAVLVTTKNGQRDIRKCIDAGHLTWFYHGILAWMPLPEPYQEGGEQ